MTPIEQAMWRDIAEAIEPYCVNGASYIRDYLEDECCLGFELTGCTIELTVEPILENGKIHGPEMRKFPIETFEGQDDCNG